ncbi:hypothetical protein EMIHUDRAFT_241085 [Emiliania huxleyi CCMP1516]|uniref:Trichome birefringence-like C-terminal domain-containing protein n=2 Tax=Emiliania huxleyi TaxID=2903 RepID=A0A0D3JDA6_EMIH1|nr:hypothetical protein EMIHUDRAFT_105843 [Emiliania huxleyi CCMP1516]XP_005773920.1 hypothetical protein EMIHUDRAFT_241085 [Emiliania huxleyi CCMP1516]EOD08791.1 hypothetical protein EMIHUDRAFT_105843 [Emiliania huxleyi CCMP1516]EOD21491.1 hypothetical protein EMIHUDRAFT_241085 [Emiliania huxleyi CCMP1516]|eukprot:XP_005761220.1 hypothetical protein EMIHUDRAFT_105843 [Emiliania huxleyi CCMP1516]
MLETSQRRTGAAASPWCFDGSAAGPSCNTCSRYAQGAWVQTEKPPLYRLTSSLLAVRAGVSISNRSTHHYGNCADQHERRHGGRSSIPEREWRPTGCRLEQFERERACATLRSVGRSLLIVGDSTTGQLFLSISMMLGATLGRNRDKKSVLNDVTASACNDTVRISFVRRDLLLFAMHQHEIGQVRRCNPRFRELIGTSLYPRRASIADAVVLSTGHHHPAVQEQLGRSADAFFTRSLNHTLQSIARLRAARGKPPASLVVLGATLPVPHCTRYSQPIDLAEYLAADAGERRVRYGNSWRRITRLNWVASTLARAAGASYLAVDELSARRPDAAMAQAAAAAEPTSEAAKRVPDCLHYCQPGPTDAWSNLLLNLLASWQRGGLRLPAAAGDGFFGVEADKWVSMRGAGLHLERSSQRSADKAPSLTKEWWWPFGNCSRTREKRATELIRAM